MTEGVARLQLRGSRSVCTCQHHVSWEIVNHGEWFWLRQAPTFFLYNCTLQYSRFIVEYSVIVGRNLVWLEINLAPTMTILYCYSNQDELLSCHHKFAAYGRTLQLNTCPTIPHNQSEERTPRDYLLSQSSRCGCFTAENQISNIVQNIMQ